MNKKLEVALITTDQLHNEFDKIKELIKNELLKEINQSQQKELFTRMELAKYLMQYCYLDLNSLVDYNHNSKKLMQ